jgi:hypothetical protein
VVGRSNPPVGHNGSLLGSKPWSVGREALALVGQLAGRRLPRNDKRARLVDEASRLSSGENP